MVRKTIEAGRSQLAGMALNNIANTMTSINNQIKALKAGRSTTVARQQEKCYKVLEANAGNLDTYVNAAPRGQEVFNYMGELIESLTTKDNRAA